MNQWAYALNGIKQKTRIRAEQGADRVLTNLKLNLLGQNQNELAITNDLLILHNGFLAREYYNKTGHIKNIISYYCSNWALNCWNIYMESLVNPEKSAKKILISLENIIF